MVLTEQSENILAIWRIEWTVTCELSEIVKLDVGFTVKYEFRLLFKSRVEYKCAVLWCRRLQLSRVITHHTLQILFGPNL